MIDVYFDRNWHSRHIQKPTFFYRRPLFLPLLNQVEPSAAKNKCNWYEKTDGDCCCCRAHLRLFALWLVPEIESWRWIGPVRQQGGHWHDLHRARWRLFVRCENGGRTANGRFLYLQKTKKKTKKKCPKSDFADPLRLRVQTNLTKVWRQKRKTPSKLMSHWCIALSFIRIVNSFFVKHFHITFHLLLLLLLHLFPLYICNWIWTQKKNRKRKKKRYSIHTFGM